MTTKKPSEAQKRRKAPKLPNGKAEFFLPEWLVTGQFNLLRVQQEPPPAAQDPKK